MASFHSTSWLSSIPLSRYTTISCYSSVNGHQYGFRSFAIVNCAAVHRAAELSVSLECRSRFIHCLIGLWNFWLCLICLRIFNHEVMLHVAEIFLCLYWDDHRDLVFALLLWCIWFIDFCVLKHPWRRWVICFKYSRILLTSISWRIFASLFIRSIGL